MSKGVKLSIFTPENLQKKVVHLMK